MCCPVVVHIWCYRSFAVPTIVWWYWSGIHPVAMEQVEEVWNKMIPALVSSFDTSKPISQIQFLEYNNYIFSYTINRYTSSFKEQSMFSVSQGLALLYERIGNWISDYLKIFLKEGKEMQGEELLKFYTSRWESYRFSSCVVDAIFSYLNQHYIYRCKKDRSASVYTIYDLSLVLWRSELFSQATPAVLKLVDKDRKGEVIDKALVRKVVDCCIELGVEESDTKSRKDGVKKPSKLAVYQEYLEKDMLKQLEEFCAAESASLIAYATVPEYMIAIEKRLCLETTRVREMMHPSSSEPLVRVIENTAIRPYISFIQSEFDKLLRGFEQEHMARMYNLLSLVQDPGLCDLRNKLYEYVVMQGNEEIDSCAAEAAADPHLYIERLLAVHKKYNKLIQESFANDFGFVTALDKACVNFINKNRVTRNKDGVFEPKISSILLAKHCDMLLKKGNKNEKEDLDTALHNVVVVFNYIQEKDYFQKYYKTYLAKRLVFQQSASGDTEGLMVSKLKIAAGCDFVNPMERMIKDIRLSSDFNSEFTHYTKKKHDMKLDFSIFVLSHNTWPLNNTQPKFILPVEFESSVKAFTDFYNGKLNGRKLEWIWDHCRGDVLHKKHTFHTSTFQAAVLLQYNSGDEYSIQALASNTGLQMSALKQVLHILVKVNLLRSDDTTSAELDNGSAPETAVIKFNDAYKNKKTRMNINVPLKTEVRRETEKMDKSLEEDRKIVIQASIVRIMKMRQRIKHQNLLGEIPLQLKNKFIPTVPMIKRCIDFLIDKEYMKREEDVYPPEYTYIA